MTQVGQNLGRYRLGAELGRGGMGAVYRAESTAAGPAGPPGTVVAIKVCHEHLLDDERSLERFEREAEVGLRIDHENVVATYEAGAEGLARFIALEFIEGQTLKELKEELGIVPDHLLYQIAEQALSALSALHALGIIHRDIKPENIVITPDHRVLLMDLGVARLETAETLTHAGEFVGSLIYAAPEQFFAQDDVGPPADLYAFGVMLLELATGKKAYDTESFHELFGKKLSEELPTPREFFPDVDAFWDRVIFTCTRKDIAKRFAGADELSAILKDGEQSAWWRTRSGTAEVMAGGERALRRLRLDRELPLVGRADDLAHLREVAAGACRTGGIELVGGLSGAGKSRLVYEFLEEVAAGEGGPVIAAGRAVGAGGRSYQPFVEALSDLLEVDTEEPGRQRAALEQRLAALLPESPGAVAPFASFLLGGIQPGAATGFTKDALHSAFANALRHAAQDRPIVVVVEDLHLAGPETLELFTYLTRCVEGHPLLLLGIFAEDEVEDGSDLHGLLNARRADIHTVAPLSADNTYELIRAVVGTESTVREIAHSLHELADGNPLILTEMLGHLKETGALVAAEAGGLTFSGNLDEIKLPSSLQDLANLKLGRLDDDQRETLEAAAVLGYEFEASVLGAVLEEKRIKLLKRLATLERKHRLIRSSGKNSFRFTSRQLYEATYESIPEALRGEYHSVVADTIRDQDETSDGDAGGNEPSGKTAYDLLFHLSRAERTLEAEPFLSAALGYLAANYHAGFAARFVERIEPDLSIGRPPARFALLSHAWDFYELLGRRDDQLRVLEGALKLAEEADDAGRRGQVHSRLAVTHWNKGDFDQASDHAERGIELAREAGDRQWESNSLHTLGGVAYRRGDFQAAADRWREALEIRKKIGDRRGEASSLGAYAEVMPRVGEGERALRAKRESLAIFREIGDRRGECALRSNIANSLVEAGQPEESLPDFESAAAIARELGDLASEAIPLANAGRALSILGRLEPARQALMRALEIFRGMGHPAGEVQVLNLLGPAVAQLGDLETSKGHLEDACRIAEERGATPMLLTAKEALGKTLHMRDEREAAWSTWEEGLALAAESDNAQREFTIRLTMGAAALIERDFDKAVEPLRLAAKNCPTFGAGSAHLILLCRCRLAWALNGAGERDAAHAEAAQARTLHEQHPGVPPADAAEIHFTLAAFSEEDDAGNRHLAQARDIVETNAEHLGADEARDFYKTTWPNGEILALAAARL